MEHNLPTRKNTRLKEFDYNTPGAYFITICTKNRQCILSSIKEDVGGGVLDTPIAILSKYGVVVEKVIKQFNVFYECFNVEKFVIMPNHVHFILYIVNGGVSGTPHPTKQNSAVSMFVSSFKRCCNKEIGTNIWQKSFYDHIIRNEQDLDVHMKYIEENPLKWALDELYCEDCKK